MGDDSRSWEVHTTAAMGFASFVVLLFFADTPMQRIYCLKAMALLALVGCWWAPTKALWSITWFLALMCIAFIFVIRNGI